jgi:D-amino peptidase
VGIDAAEAGVHGVPEIMVSGDDKVCAETKELLGPETVTCQVKTGLARHYVRTKPPVAAQALIREAAEKAVQNANRVQPFKPAPPYVVRLEYNLTAGADGVRCDGVKTIREGPRTVVFKGDDLLEVITRSL